MEKEGFKMITKKQKIRQLKKEIKLLVESIKLSPEGKKQYLRELKIFKSILEDYEK